MKRYWTSSLLVVSTLLNPMAMAEGLSVPNIDAAAVAADVLSEAAKVKLNAELYFYQAVMLAKKKQEVLNNTLVVQPQNMDTNRSFMINFGTDFVLISMATVAVATGSRKLLINKATAEKMAEANRVTAEVNKLVSEQKRLVGNVNKLARFEEVTRLIAERNSELVAVNSTAEIASRLAWFRRIGKVTLASFYGTALASAVLEGEAVRVDIPASDEAKIPARIEELRHILGYETASN